MKKTESSHSTLKNRITTEEQRKMAISKANVVKEDINQLLMYLGANNDVNAIAQKMDQLGQDIADLDSYFCNCYGKRGPTHRKLGRMTSEPRHDAMLN